MNPDAEPLQLLWFKIDEMQLFVDTVAFGEMLLLFFRRAGDRPWSDRDVFVCRPQLVKRVFALGVRTC